MVHTQHTTNSWSRDAHQSLNVVVVSVVPHAHTVLVPFFSHSAVQSLFFFSFFYMLWSAMWCMSLTLQVYSFIVRIILFHSSNIMKESKQAQGFTPMSHPHLALLLVYILSMICISEYANHNLILCFRMMPWWNLHHCWVVLNNERKPVYCIRSPFCYLFSLHEKTLHAQFYINLCSSCHPMFKFGAS